MRADEKWGPGYKYGYGHVFSPERCKASVHDDGRSPTFHQCTRAPADGCDGFCRMHANQYIKKPTGEKVYAIYVGYGGDASPELVEAAVVKRSEKQVVIDYGNNGLAFGCRERNKPEYMHFTPEAAWEAYRASLLREISTLVAKTEEARRLLSLTSVDGGRR